MCTAPWIMVSQSVFCDRNKTENLSRDALAQTDFPFTNWDKNMSCDNDQLKGC